MGRRTIRLEGDPVLRRRAARIERIDAEVRQLAEDLWETMRHAGGAGLAAPQIGVSRRLIVVEIDPEEDRTLAAPLRLRLVNPAITRSRGASSDLEGCLSIPGLRGEVPRAARITVVATDLDDRPVRLDLAGWAGRIVQHEIDHLDGILYQDRMLPGSPLLPVLPAGSRPHRSRRG